MIVEEFIKKLLVLKCEIVRHYLGERLMEAEPERADFEIDLEKIQFKRLTGESDVSDFDCGDSKEEEDLNDFLKNDALNHQNKRMGNTQLVHYKNKVVAFFTLMMDKVHLSEKEKKKVDLKEFGYTYLPALKVGRFAVDRRYQHKGVGPYLIKVITGLALAEDSEYPACRFITVDSYVSKVPWYEGLGFEKNEAVKPGDNTISMRYDLEPLKTVKIEEIPDYKDDDA